jgi:hypothetical protein
MADLPLRCRGERPNGRPCGNLLGWLVDGRLRVKVGGRTVDGIALTPELVIRCEDCGEPWRPLFASGAGMGARAW